MGLINYSSKISLSLPPPPSPSLHSQLGTIFRHQPLDMNTNETFAKRLGEVSFVQNGKKYTARIADSTQLVDDVHQRYFDDAIAWIHYLEQIYPDGTKRKQQPLTAHEFVKMFGENEAPINEPIPTMKTTPIQIKKRSSDRRRTWLDGVYDFDNEDDGDMADNDDDD